MATPSPGSPSPLGVELAELRALPALGGSRLVWGGGVPVVVRTLTLDDAAAPAAADTLLLAAAAPERPPEGVAAVICRRAPAVDPGVPVVELGAEVAWGPVLSQLAAALGGGANRDAAREAFRLPLVAGRGFPGLAEVAQRFLGAPVAILDEYLDTLATAGLGEVELAAVDEAVEAARSHGPASLLGPFIDEDMPGTIRQLTTGPGGVTGALVIWHRTPLDAAGHTVVAELAEACALERAREAVRTETEARLRGDLVEELVAGEAIGRDSLVRRARHLGADLSGGAVAVYGALQDPHTDGRHVGDERLVRRVLQQARVTLDAAAPRSLVDWRDERLLVLLPPASGEGADPALTESAVEARHAIEERAQVVARRLLAAVTQTVPGLALTLALSRHTPQPERLGAALDEAALALSIGERLGRMGEVVTFEETGTYKLLFQIFADRPQELDAFYEQTIAPLVRYDEQYQTELVTTLATYLGHDGNLAATAATLYTHRHTVRYRLDRIAELSGLEIGRTDDREKLSLGLKAMRLLGRRVAAVEERRRPADRNPGRARG